MLLQAAGPPSSSPDSPERFGAISVPIQIDSSVVGCVSCGWLPAVASEQDIVTRHLEDLKGADQGTHAMHKARAR